MTTELEARPETDVVGDRLLNATPEEVYRAFTHNEHLERFWGPEGFTCTTRMFEPRPGGRWDIIMHGPDGKDYPNQWKYDALEPNSRVVMHHLGPVHAFLVTATIEEEDGRARLRWHQRFESEKEFDRPFIESVLQQIFDRLEAELARMRG